MSSIVFALAPEDPEWHLDIAYALSSDDTLDFYDKQQALAHYQRAIELDADFSLAYASAASFTRDVEISRTP